MKPYIYLILFLLFLTATAFSEEPKWPEPGSAYPKGKELKRPKISEERLGTNYWTSPPAIISPYEPSWYDYTPIMWGVENQLKGNNQPFYQILKKAYLRAGSVYSEHGSAPLSKAKLPFYNTNLTNLLYTSNKGGTKTKKAYKKSRNRKHAIRLARGKSASLEDPTVDKQERKNARHIAKDAAPHKSLGYDLRDEATYVISSCTPFDLDFSKVSLKYFRIWLKNKYKTLSALNAEWNTNFSSWESVYPLTTDEIQSREFKRQKKKKGFTELPDLNLTPWADHREYNDDTMHAAIARYTKEVHSQDPLSPVGYSGTQMPSAYGGFDFWKLCNNISWSEYYEICGSREIIRSFLPRRYPSISAIFLGKDPKKLEANFSRLWRVALHGDPGALVWPYAGSTKKTTFLNVDGQNISLNTIGKIVQKNFKELRNGAICLLNNAEFEIQPIAVYYSQPSIRADWMLEVKRDGKSWINRSSSWESSHNYGATGREGFYKILEDLGYQYSIMAPQQIFNDKLEKNKIKVLILPRTIAISKKEIQVFEKFVANGGIIISDLLAARMNENCHVWKGNKTTPMDKLMGVQRSGFAYEEDKKDEVLSGGYKGGYGRKFKINIKKDFFGLKKGETINLQGFQEPGLKISTGTALAQTSWGPALIENKTGKGYFYTMNFDAPNYLTQRAGKKKEDINNAKFQRKILQALLNKADIKPTFSIVDKKSKEYPAGLETFHLKKNKIDYLAVHTNGTVLIEWATLANQGAGVSDISGRVITFKIPEKRYVTEIMSGKDLGLCDTFEFTLVKNKPLIFSLLPYKVTAIKAKIGSTVKDQKLSVDLSITTKGKPGNHVVHAELFDQAGNIIPESLVNIPLANGKYKGAIDLSHFNVKGPYKLKIKDVATGLSSEFDVK